ncbi:Uncharacterised protein [Mycobacteroides abscessus subsp. abscessus]|nr:Uncharacterised protein [Mycobacteroides abscessus subsp. abscessus]
MKTTRAPSSASLRTMPAPMPRDPPVTNARRLFNGDVMVLLP